MKWPDIAPIAAKLTMPPGKAVVLVPDEQPETSAVSLPDFAVANRRHLAVYGKDIDTGILVKDYTERDRRRNVSYPVLKAGTLVGVDATQGLRIEPNDSDSPEVGAVVPEGFSLRFYGCRMDATEQVLVTL